MNIVFLESTVDDLRWFLSYYNTVFSEGFEKAQKYYHETLHALRAHPLIGKEVLETHGIREILIPQTPFSFVYYLSGDEIRIIRIRDARSKRFP